MKLLAALALSFVFASATLAQQPDGPAPILRASVNPPATVVGQKVTLVIDVLAPNYMTKPPVLPDFQIRNAVTRNGATINLSEQVNGVTFAGVRFEFSIYPQEPGNFAVSGQTVTITYAVNPPQTREASLQIPPLSFEATIPDAAQMLDPFISATRLVVRQDIKPSSDPLKVGDSVTRTVTIEAEGTPAMLLPAPSLVRVDGADVYPAQPEFQDKSDSRTDALTARRVDQATYMLQRAGEFALPAIDIGWWNVRAQKVEHAGVAPVSLPVTENPAIKPPGENTRSLSPRRIVLFLADHLWALLAIVIVGCTLAWFAPRAIARLSDQMRRRREAYRRSEAFAFANFRAAARHGDAGRTYFALLNWLARFAPGLSLQAFRAAAHDAELDAQIGAIESHLFGTAPSVQAQRSTSKLAGCVASARRRLRRTSMSANRPSPLLSTLNPCEDHALSRQRPVAR